MRIVIVGAGLAGLRTAEALRSEGFDGEVALVGEEARYPYDRPALSKGVLAGEKTADDVLLAQPEKLRDLKVELHLGVPAQRLDPVAHKVVLRSGAVMSYDQLVIASGASARWLRGTSDLRGAHVLRTLDDALALQHELVAGANIVIAGAGVLGCEIAATLRTCGHPVALVDPSPGPMWGALAGAASPVLSDLVRTWHEQNGVELYFGHGISDVHAENGRVQEVRLDDGKVLPADVLVSAVGVSPCTDWLEGSGVALQDGVVCDEYCAVEGDAVEDVWAVGDVARWRHVGQQEPVRIEHWMNAANMAHAVASNILAATDMRSAYQPVPYFWSDQYGRKLQSVGFLGVADRTMVIRDEEVGGRFLAACARDEQLVGGVGVRQAPAVMATMRMINSRNSFNEAIASLS